MNKNFSSNLLNKIITTGIILTFLALLSTPLILTAIFKSRLGIINSNIPISISIGLYICAIPYIIALFILKKISKQIAIKDPFNIKIPILLEQISICAFSEIILFNIVCIVLYYVFNIYLYGITIMSSIVVSFVSLAIGVLSIVLSQLIKIAIEIKDENDKTI